MTIETILTDEEIETIIGQQVRAMGSGVDGYILPITFARAIEQAILHKYRDLRAEMVILREALEQCRFTLEPYDDVKPRDWVTDREKLRRAHEVAKAALAQGEI